MQITQNTVIPEVFCRESTLKENGSSTKDLEDDVFNKLLSEVHRHVTFYYCSKYGQSLIFCELVI